MKFLQALLVSMLTDVNLVGNSHISDCMGSVALLGILHGVLERRRKGPGVVKHTRCGFSKYPASTIVSPNLAKFNT